jgi:phosphoribosylaminoimidazolecarboxamide formyltransferase / IMP cyclohydrolase
MEIHKTPEILNIQLQRKETLRYGENPHQTASVYFDGTDPGGTIASAKQLNGKQLSFNNYMDLESAKNMVSDFDEPAVAIVKHTNPCGAAIGKDIEEAYRKALACDPVSAFGSIIAVNRELDRETALLMKELFIEAVIAPRFSEEAMEILKKKKNLRLIDAGDFARCSGMDLEFKKISGGMLIEEADRSIVTEKDLTFVTEKRPTSEEIRELLFAQNLVKHIKSNAILLSLNGATVGIGAGQMSRIDALELAVKKANSPVKGCVLASDAFFPFRDSVDKAAEYGISAIIQPGGSVKDEDSIKACNEHGIAMVFTGLRSFRHL